MPAKLERCVNRVMDQGKSKDSAYAICVKSTGCKRKKGGGWTKGKKTVKEYVEMPDFETFFKDQTGE